ncbi:hypothetical protein HZY97_20355 [Sphingomonas sp. R-74633]|uniref:hypothetical protein n=1 Tax=Sphingomonas sp. R-74633 TaxID=2751188 RepID=UPI0015D41D52|nr:hypothetical protein [Sphingomonas sp. R-74633]NYT43139.1 hypothetical protein [Sphingomonas sp. R-74633]
MILSASPNAPADPDAGKPAMRHDWHGLAAAAERLLADRFKSDPASVEAGRMTMLEAQNRQLTMRDLASIWRAVVRREPMPELAVSHAATRADLEAAAAAWAKIAKGRPDDQGCADLAALVAALAWHHQPMTPAGTPAIVLLHISNQHTRALAANRPAKPATMPIPTPAPAPQRGTTRPKAAPQQQKGLF